MFDLELITPYITKDEPFGPIDAFSWAYVCMSMFSCHQGPCAHVSSRLYADSRSCSSILVF